MKKVFLYCTTMLLFVSAKGQFETKLNIQYSNIVQDSFEIYITLPKNYNTLSNYNVIYYCDANLNSGKRLRELITTNNYKNLQKSIFVGIGHIGNFHVLRRRDFILPSILGSDTVGRSRNYGQVEKFYSFLKFELIPSINLEFKTNIDSNGILGHSLGGLFSFYCLLKSDNLFKKYYSLSPALWIDRYSIYKFNKIEDGFTSQKYLYFAAGSDETFNKILKGTNDLKRFLDTAKYNHLVYEYDIWPGENHNSEVELSLEKILKERL